MAATSIGPLERRVMTHLWRTGPATVGEVLETLNAALPRALAYTTVLTVLVRLEEKGYATRQREGRLFRYAAAFAEEAFGDEIGRRELRQLIDRHGAESLAGFAADLVGAGAELATSLRRIADEET